MIKKIFYTFIVLLSLTGTIAFSAFFFSNLGESIEGLEYIYLFLGIFFWALPSLFIWKGTKLIPIISNLFFPLRIIFFIFSIIFLPVGIFFALWGIWIKS